MLPFFRKHFAGSGPEYGTINRQFLGATGILDLIIPAVIVLTRYTTGVGESGTSLLNSSTSIEYVGAPVTVMNPVSALTSMIFSGPLPAVVIPRNRLKMSLLLLGGTVETPTV